jgi:hypothetical protein
MNAQEEHIQDQLEIAASQAIGLIYLLSNAVTRQADDPGGGPNPSETDGIEMLTVMIGSDLKTAVDRINNRLPGQTDAMPLAGNSHVTSMENQLKGGAV